eukprot:7744568-Karenia_brevis.AAC.1
MERSFILPLPNCCVWYPTVSTPRERQSINISKACASHTRTVVIFCNLLVGMMATSRDPENHFQCGDLNASTVRFLVVGLAL